nr:pectate lyase [uncultured Rhodoferax sp.]
MHSGPHLTEDARTVPVSPPATSSGGFAITSGGNVSGAWERSAATLQDMIKAVAAAKAAGKPLVLTYTGNEDALIARVIRDHTADADHNCPVPHWNAPYRELQIKDFPFGLTIQGAQGSSAHFGITLIRSPHVIIRNMKIGALAGAAHDADMLRIDSSSHVWIDHNELFAVNNECKGSPEGDLTFESAIDIKKDAHYITVSYNDIHDNKKVSLDGASSTDIAGGREITYHHNIYRNVHARLPLQRGGWTHIYNNLYSGITESGINVRQAGYALIENNWFENARNPVTCRHDSDNCGWWELRGNNTQRAADNATYHITWSSGPGYINADTWTSTRLFPLVLPYPYIAHPPSCVKARLAAVAGVGKGLATLRCD